MLEGHLLGNIKVCHVQEVGKCQGSQLEGILPLQVTLGDVWRQL